MIDKIIMTDTHWGVKNNSSKFLENQMLIFEELFDDIPAGHRFDIVHCGDIFDSRSTLSVMVMDRVKNLLENIYIKLMKFHPDNRMIFVAGNHDFYSPNDNRVSSLDTILRQWLPYDNVYMVTQVPLLLEDDLYVPWFVIDDPTEMKKVCRISKFENIFTHTDLHRLNNDLAFLHNYNIYSGHIHNNSYVPNNGYTQVNLTPPYSMDFGDANKYNKGIWRIWNNKLELRTCSKTKQFHYIYNEDIFNISEDWVTRGDNINVYINRDNLTEPRYVEQIKYISSQLQYCNIIPQMSDIVVEDGCSGEEINVDDVIIKLIGKEYKHILNEIKEVHDNKKN